MPETAQGWHELLPDELPVLADIWVASWTLILPSFDFEGQRGWFAEHMVGLATEGAHIRVLSIAAVAVGFVTVHPMTGYIDQLALAPSLWGTGTAAALLDEAQRLSPYRLELLVNKDNPRAVRFYEKYGFTKAGESFSAKSGLPLWKMVFEPA